MKIRYSNFRLICGRLYMLANGVYRPVLYGIPKDPFVTASNPPG